MKFRDYVKKYGLSQDNYPHSKTGIKIARTMLTIIIIMLSCGIFGGLFKATTFFIPNNPPEQKITQVEKKQQEIEESIGESTELTESPITSIFDLFNPPNKSVESNSGDLIDEKKVNFISETLNNDPYLSVRDFTGFFYQKMLILTNFLSQLLLIKVQLFLLGVLAFLFVLHVINAIRRQRAYERNVIVNDWKSEFLRRKVSSSMNLNIKKREAAQKISKASKTTSSGGTSAVYNDDYMKLKAFTSLAKMKVYINTRQSLQGGDKLQTQYRVRFDLPVEADASQILEKQLDDVSNTITKVCLGVVKFGKPFTSDDRQYLVVRGVLLSDDKYSANSTSKNQVIDDPSNYQSTFSIDLLISNKEELEEAKDNAFGWTSDMKVQLDSFLATSKVQATFSNTELGSTTALFIFDKPADTSVQSMYSEMENALDSLINMSGSVVKSEASKLYITLPLPPEYRSKIDIPTLYQEAFGGQ